VRTASTLGFTVAFLFVAACSGELDSGPGDPDPDENEADAAPDVTLNRVTEGLQLLYHFRGGTAGQIAIQDTSGVAPAHDLTIVDPLAVTWLADSIQITAPTIITSLTPPAKVITACQASDAYSIEAFVRAANLAQVGPARIATLSIDANNRNFSLLQENADYRFRLRTAGPESNNNGAPELTKGLISELALQHVVYTRNAVGVEHVYVDGVQVGAPDTRSGTYDNWDALYQFAIGNEIGNGAPWLGQIALVAVYCQELSEAEVTQNYNAGY